MNIVYRKYGLSEDSILYLVFTKGFQQRFDVERNYLLQCIEMHKPSK